MSGKKLLLKYVDTTEYDKIARRISMDISAYFTTLEYILMGSTFLAVLLIFLYAYYGKDDEESNE